MLVNYPEFIFIFLSITLFLFFKIYNLIFYKLAISWLITASFFFYGWWNLPYSILFIFLILFNYLIGIFIIGHYRFFKQKYFLIWRFLLTLCILGYFKYINLVLTNTNELFRTFFNLQSIVSPLPISFSRFNHIAYLVDAYRCEAIGIKYLY